MKKTTAQQVLQIVRETGMIRGRELAARGFSPTHLQRQRQWAAFLAKTVLRQGAVALPELIGTIRNFLQPLLLALAEDRSFDLQWSPAGYWQAMGGAVDQEPGASRTA